MAVAPDFEDLIKDIKPTANAQNIAAATIALRLIRAQLNGGIGNDLATTFDNGTTPGSSAFAALTAKIKAEIGTL